MENKEKGGAAFTAPAAVKNEGVAEAPKAGGTVTAKALTKKSAEAVGKKVRDIKVVAIAKGFFDTKRYEPGKKFMVSESEFSEHWMQKI